MSIKKTKLEKSKEFQELYFTLFKIHTVAMTFINEGETDAEKKVRAKKVIADLENVGYLETMSDKRCFDPGSRTFYDC